MAQTAVVKGSDYIDIGRVPQSPAEEVIRNVAIILAARANSIPLARDLGLLWDFVDKNPLVGKTMMVAEITEKVNRFEPRASVRSVEFETVETSGRVVPVVEVEINA